MVKTNKNPNQRWPWGVSWGFFQTIPPHKKIRTLEQCVPTNALLERGGMIDETARRAPIFAKYLQKHRRTRKLLPAFFLEKAPQETWTKQCNHLCKVEALQPSKGGATGCDLQKRVDGGITKAANHGRMIIRVMPGGVGTINPLVAWVMAWVMEWDYSMGLFACLWVYPGVWGLLLVFLVCFFLLLWGGCQGCTS